MFGTVWLRALAWQVWLNLANLTTGSEVEPAFDFFAALRSLAGIR